MLAGCTRAIAGAVTLASIARRTDEDCRAATSTEKTADGFLHRRSSNNRRGHRQAKAPRAMLAERSYSLRWRGRGIRFYCNVYADAASGFLRPFPTLCTASIKQPSPKHLQKTPQPTGCCDKSRRAYALRPTLRPFRQPSTRDRCRLWTTPHTGFGLLLRRGCLVER